MRPSEFVAPSSVDRSGVSAEVASELPSPSSESSPIAEAISESGDSAEVSAEDVGSVPSAEDRASLKLVPPVLAVPAVAPSDDPADGVEVVEEDEAGALGSRICCCIARIWSMRLVTASILIVHCDRRRRRELERDQWSRNTERMPSSATRCSTSSATDGGSTEYSTPLSP